MFEGPVDYGYFLNCHWDVKPPAGRPRCSSVWDSSLFQRWRRGKDFDSSIVQKRISACGCEAPYCETWNLHFRTFLFLFSSFFLNWHDSYYWIWPFLVKDFLSFLDFHITSEISTESVIAFISWYLPGSALASCNIVPSLLLTFQGCYSLMLDNYEKPVAIWRSFLSKETPSFKTIQSHVL